MSILFDIRPPYLVDQIFPPFQEQEDWLALQHSHLVSPSSTDSQFLRSWLMRSLEEFDIRATSLAKLAGIAPSTLNRFLDQKESGGSLNARTINKISKVFQEEANRLARREWKEIEEKSGGAEPSECSKLGVVREDEWQHRISTVEENEERGAYPVLTVPVVFPYARHPMACFEVNTSNHDPVFPMHSTVFCSPIARTRILPVSEQPVVLLEAGPRRTFRSFLRRYVKDPTGREWLVPIGSWATKKTSAMLIEDASMDADALRVAFTVVGVHTNLVSEADLPLPLP